MAKDQNHNVDMEFFTAAGVAAAGGFAVSVGEKAYRYMKSRDPLVVKTIFSRLNEAKPDAKTVEFRIR